MPKTQDSILKKYSELTSNDPDKAIEYIINELTDKSKKKSVVFVEGNIYLLKLDDDTYFDPIKKRFYEISEGKPKESGLFSKRGRKKTDDIVYDLKERGYSPFIQKLSCIDDLANERNFLRISTKSSNHQDLIKKYDNEINQFVQKYL